MARVRDYKAEEARRNARARASGFTSRAHERGIRRKAAKWSSQHARKPIATYHSRWGSEKVRAYYEAFVGGKDGFPSLSKRKREGTAIRYWMVDMTEYMTPEEYDSGYIV